MTITLYNDQQILKDDIYRAWQQGYQNIMAVSPTGGGKSVVVSDFALDFARNNMQQAIIAHRNELVSQMSIHIAMRGIPHKIIGSKTTISQITRQHRAKFGRSFVNPSAPTAVVGVDTLVARKDDLAAWAKQTDRWTVDEAHHVIGGKDPNKWGKAVAMFPNALGLGVTATPLRADGQGLGREYEGVFDIMCVGLEMRELINIGRLADYEIVCPESDLIMDDQEVSASGDWSNQKLRKAAKKSHIIGDVVEAYCRYAYNKQAICFATDVETAGEISTNFNRSGIRAASLSAKTPAAVREKYIQEFREGKLMVLVNVDLFDEGFDVPACEVVIMARPTASLGKYRQMVGRCLRVMAGKPFGLIIDHVSNVVRHGYPDKHVAWTLARRDKRGRQAKDPDEIELTVCKHCTKPYEKYYVVCPYCGMEQPLPEPRDRTIEMVEGDLILLDRAKLAEMRQAMELENPGNVSAPDSPNNVLRRAAINRQMEKITSHKRLDDAIAQWAGVQFAKGFKQREIEKKFYLTMGCDVLTALGGSRKRVEYDTMATTVEGWYQ